MIFLILFLVLDVHFCTCNELLGLFFSWVASCGTTTMRIFATLPTTNVACGDVREVGVARGYLRFAGFNGLL